MSVVPSLTRPTPHPGALPLRPHPAQTSIPTLRREVKPMKRQLPRVPVFRPRPGRKERTQFNAQLLEQRREDVYLTLHQMGLIR